MINKKKKITFWSPHISQVATVKAVYNSAKSLKKFSNLEFEPEIIDSFGEWEQIENNSLGIKIHKLHSINFIKKISSKGFIFSRIKYILIFIFSFIPLTLYLKNKRPSYFIIHLITSLPLFLNYLFNFKSKIILRISGKPKLNILRYMFWKIVLKKVYKITFPTKETYEYFKSLQITDNSKLFLLYDPVLNINEINFSKKGIIQNQINFDNFYLCIGRLTKQKNFLFIINCFKDLISAKKNLKLLIMGEGEDYKKLKLLIEKYELQKNIFLIGYKKNVNFYLKKAKGFILSSLWEDPGFVLIEAMYANTPIISSDCPSGPKELIGFQNGILFKSNSKTDFLKKFKYFEDLDKKKIYQMKLNAKKKVRQFTLFYHYKNLRKFILI